MGLAKKGSRTISVDGELYRWVVSPDDGYCVVVVEHATNPGQRLAVHCDPYPDVGHVKTNEPSAPKTHRTIGPGAVARLIRSALSQGWVSQSNRGSEFLLQSADEILWPPVDNTGQ